MMIVSKHAKEELHRRGIPMDVFEAVLAAPEQKVPGHGTIVCYQSKVIIEGKRYLVRVMVDENRKPPVVVTVYRTSKANKYWRKK